MIYEIFKGKYYCGSKDLTLMQAVKHTAVFNPTITAMTAFYTASVEKLPLSKIIDCFADPKCPDYLTVFSLSIKHT